MNDKGGEGKQPQFTLSHYLRIFLEELRKTMKMLVKIASLWNDNLTKDPLNTEQSPNNYTTMFNLVLYTANEESIKFVIFMNCTAPHGPVVCALQL